jgi:hypothetical protein
VHDRTGEQVSETPLVDILHREADDKGFESFSARLLDDARLLPRCPYFSSMDPTSPTTTWATSTTSMV